MKDFALSLWKKISWGLTYFGLFTVKPALSGHYNIDKSKVIKTSGSLMKVESIAECSLGAFCNSFDLH